MKFEARSRVLYMGEYHSNAFNQRVYRSDAGAVSMYTYGPSGEMLWESGQAAKDYVWLDGELLGIVRSGQFYASHNDPNGRPEVLTDFSGNVVEKRAEITTGLRGVILTMMIPGRLVFALTTCLRRSEIIETFFEKLFRREGEQFLSFAPKVVRTCTANLTRQY